MLFDRTQACPMLDDRDSLNSYFDVSGEEVFLAMDSEESTTEEDLSETCYWIIRPERDLWLPEQSEMKIWLEEVEGGGLFLFQGNERSNATKSLIEDGLMFVPGAPLTLSTNDDTILLFFR